MKNHQWGLTENEKKVILSRITGTTSYTDFQHCDFVIEVIGIMTIPVNGDQCEKFRQLEQVLDSTAIIASNVATVMMTELASN